MHADNLPQWQHDHIFGMDQRTHGEKRTLWVILITLTMMVIEIVAGIRYGSMALLADGWHMGTHAAALSITVFAYYFARRNVQNKQFSFGTGKVGALGGFASSIGLAIVAAYIFFESVFRLSSPIAIQFNEAIFVAVIGLIVNMTCALILKDHHHDHHSEHHDHNLKAAYLHVLADALTSLLAIVALLIGKYLGWIWMDPVMGIVGSVVIAKWSYGLIRNTSNVLLDAEFSEEKLSRVRNLLEEQGSDRVVDLHLWRVGPQHLAAIVSIVTHEPKEVEYYKSLLSKEKDLSHITVEVHECR